MFDEVKETQMKTSHYAESFDLRHPQTLGSEHTRHSNISSELTSRNETITSSLVGASSLNATTSSATIASTSAYGSNSTNDHQHQQQPEPLIKSQQRQQQHPEQNKKRKRETGDYLKSLIQPKISFVYVECML